MAPRLAENSAQRLLDEMGITAPPIPVDELARRLGIRVMRESLRGVSGMLIRDTDRPTVIAVNSDHPPARQRFSVAHEIGHYRLHQGVFVDPSDARINLRSSRSSTGLDRDEIQANAFAAALLMPEQMVTSAVVAERDASASHIVSTLAKLFEVSEQAMDIRLNVLGVFTPF